ncbi:Lipoprotein LpqB, GerMN domain protein [Syntrophobotulus glycolicus DSM 8271]|uniref:Lipoprotein LpqB, GerMN domain protein n=1 Tax=Syntrophobotulus glycolicus (strain DSM 8271 / FlGlyR) TaxID=645991 RepID=F0SY87_SYNGF|nr:Lipoprotein LpqB, GerMN domain protein [Syntrophobotulus glycolicus DSM 8271]
MKKVILFILILIPFVFLSGCTANKANNAGDDQSGNQNQNPPAQQLSVKDYFPIIENTRYVYEGQGNEYASYTVNTDYTSETKVQQRINNGGTITAKVLELKDGKLTKLLARGEAYYRENLLEAKENDKEILLMEPLVQGTTWNLTNSRVRTITNVEADVTTPSGTYKAIEVTTTSSNDKTLDYYVKDVGLVKSVTVFDQDEISSSLSKIEKDVSFVQKVSFFYPGVNDGKIYYQEKELSFKTNEMTRPALEKAYKEVPNSNVGKVFSANTKINSLYLNSDGMVYLDLNEAFLKEMNAGSGYESMILQSVADTFGKYYNAQKVILTIDGKLYESGHLRFERGQSLEVNDENAVQVK